MKRSIGHHKTLKLSARKAEQFDAFVSGLLLGDAQIGKTGSLRIGQSVKRIGWLRQVKVRLAEFGCDARISDEYTPRSSVGPHNVIRPGAAHMLTTRVYEELKIQRKRWYRDHKIVPRDLRLSAEGIAHWFVGDGNGDAFGLLRFCTNSFSVRDVNLLIRLLPVQARPVLAGRSETQHIIKVCRRDEAVKLADMMRPFLPRCALYKIKHVRPAFGRLSKAA